MKKTRSLISKTLLTTLILMLLSVPFMPKASAYNGGGGSLALPAASLFLDPFRVEGNAGDIINATLMVNDITDLFSFQTGLAFTNTTAVECTAVIEGGFLTNNGANTTLFFPGTIDNTLGIISPYGWSLLAPTPPKSGDGKVVIFTFHMKADGYSDIHFTDWTAIAGDGVTEITIQTIDYFTAVVEGNQYVSKIVGNALGTSAGSNGYSAHKVTQVDITIGPDTYHGELNFTITASGANGDPFAFFNVTIPKTMMSCAVIDKWSVTLDNIVQNGRVVLENATHTTVSLEFTYGFAPIKVQILSIDIVPEFSSVFFATLLVLATFAAAFFSKTAWSHKRKS